MKIATLDWDDNTESDLAGYIIYRDNVEIARTLPTASDYVDVAVPDNVTKACYSVAAFDNAGNVSDASAAVCRIYEIPKLHKFTITEAQDQVVVSWLPADYPKVTAPRKTTKKLVTITISKA